MPTAHKNVHFMPRSMKIGMSYLLVFMWMISSLQGTNPSMLEEFKIAMTEKFEMTDMSHVLLLGHRCQANGE